MIVTAEKTLEAIEKQMTFDHGALFKKYEQDFLPMMHDAYEVSVHPELRDHLGASVIGEPCTRKIWFNFRGFGSSAVTPRLTRLFNRGHLEEARFHAMLQACGVQTFFQNEQGKQYGYKRGIFAGSVDGIALDVPDCPNETVLLEFKTMNDARFKQFVAHDMMSFPTYENQCHVNMFCMNLFNKELLQNFDLMKKLYDGEKKVTITKTLFMAVNKNTDEIHAVIIPLDEDKARACIDKIPAVLEDCYPEGLHNHPKYFDCKMCGFNKYCYENKEFPHNCRTCSLHKFNEDGTECCGFDFEKYSEDCYVPLANNRIDFVKI